MDFLCLHEFLLVFIARQTGTHLEPRSFILTWERRLAAARRNHVHGKTTGASDVFTLQRRRAGGGTKPLTDWGFRNETDPLTDVLLGPADHLRHMATSSLSRKTLREHPADILVAKAQHLELQSAYKHFDVRIHSHLAEPELPTLVYARDSSVMTPYGAVITAMANWWRRGENFAAIRTYERLGIPIYVMVTAGTFEGGDFNVIEDGCVLIGCGGARAQEEGARQVEARCSCRRRQRAGPCLASARCLARRRT
jgi:hypothetical protein